MMISIKERMTAAEYLDMLSTPAKKKRPKYNNKTVVIDGYKFHSAKEGKRYSELKLLQAAGEIKYFLMQVPFHLAPDLTYLVDFMIVWQDGAVTYEDVKGYEVISSMNKIKMTQEKYGVIINII
jgi:photosystem II stability/assembly factor-like uncharacterized protein